MRKLMIAIAAAAALATVAAGAAAAGASSAAAMGAPDVAALQVGLQAAGMYGGQIDGLAGAQTLAALRAFQRSASLPATGRIDSLTRQALGPYGEAGDARAPVLGSAAWDVAALQFRLAWHGFPSSTINGVFSQRVARALGRFQVWAGLAPTTVADAPTLAALALPPAMSPIPLAPPIAAAATDLFGPRGQRFHTGVDFPAATGTPVAAAASGRVAYAGWLDGGWGYEVTIDHGAGVRTISAHLSRVDVVVGQRVSTGEQVGAVGASGDATGSHLHFEERLRGAAIVPNVAVGAT